MTEPSKDETPAAPIDPQNPETTEFDTSKMVSPNEDTANEETPIGDALTKELSEEEDVDIDFGDEVPFEAKSIKADVKRALERETQDGKGDDEVPESDWDSYATKNVEVQD